MLSEKISQIEFFEKGQVKLLSFLRMRSKGVKIAITNFSGRANGIDYIEIHYRAGHLRASKARRSSADRRTLNCPSPGASPKCRSSLPSHGRIFTMVLHQLKKTRRFPVAGGGRYASPPAQRPGLPPLRGSDSYFVPAGGFGRLLGPPFTPV